MFYFLTAVPHTNRSSMENHEMSSETHLEPCQPSKTGSFGKNSLRFSAVPLLELICYVKFHKIIGI